MFKFSKSLTFTDLMSFEHLKNFEGMMNFKASSICTSWSEIKTSEYFDGYPNYDYFPIMKNGSVLGLVIRAEGGSKEEVHFKGTKLFLDEEMDILDVIYRFYNNYKHDVEVEKPGLLILVNKDKPSGILTLADLNHEQVSALIWRIIKNVEINLKNALVLRSALFSRLFFILNSITLSVSLNSVP